MAIYALRFLSELDQYMRLARARAAEAKVAFMTLVANEDMSVLIMGELNL